MAPRDPKELDPDTRETGDDELAADLATLDSPITAVVDESRVRRLVEAVRAQRAADPDPEPGAGSTSEPDAVDPAMDPGITVVDADVARRVREALDAERSPDDALDRGDSTVVAAREVVREALDAPRSPGDEPDTGASTAVDADVAVREVVREELDAEGGDEAQTYDDHRRGQGSLPARRIEIIDEPDDDEPDDARGSVHAPAPPAAKGARAPSSASHRAPPSLAESPSGTRTAPREPGEGGERRATEGRRATLTDTKPRTTSPLVWVAAALAAVAALGLVVIMLTPAPPKTSERPSAPEALEPSPPQSRTATSGAARPAGTPETPRSELLAAADDDTPPAGEDSAAIKVAKPPRIRPRNEATLSAPPGDPLESVAPSGPPTGATMTGDAGAGSLGTSTLTLRGSAVDAGDRYITIKVFVDRRFVGTAPIEGYEVTAGRHTVRFDCVAGGKTYRGTQRTIDVPKNNALVVEQACEIPISASP